MSSNSFVIECEQSRRALIDSIQNMQLGSEVSITTPKKRIRTLTQNAALHKYCELLAEALNDAGLDMRRVLKQEVEIPWTMENVKEHLWRPIYAAVTQHESTTKADTSQYGEVYNVLNRHLSQKFEGLYVPWPSKK